MTYAVMIKATARRSKRWLLESSGDDLPRLLAHARTLTGPDVEVGVFVTTPSGGLLYWTSTAPEAYNQEVLRERR